MLIEKHTVTIEDLISNGVTIFDFDYPLFRNEYKEQFEQNFINYFMFHEIGSETVAKFKFRLQTRLKIIMPYWNKIYMTQELEQRILDNYDVTETYSSKNISKGLAKSVSLLNDTPKTKTNIETLDYFSSAGKNTADTEGENTTEYTLRKSGNIGVQYDSDAIIHYWDSVRNIDLEVFKDLEENLFMGVY